MTELKVQTDISRCRKKSSTKYQKFTLIKIEAWPREAKNLVACLGVFGLQTEGDFLFDRVECPNQHQSMQKKKLYKVLETHFDQNRGVAKGGEKHGGVFGRFWL